MGGNAAFRLTTGEREGVPLIVASGEVDLATSPELREALAQMSHGQHRTVVLDLSGVSFLDSTGLSVLVAFHKRFRELGGELRIVVTDRRVTKVMELVGLDDVLVLHASVEQALDSAENPPPAPGALAG